MDKQNNTMKAAVITANLDFSIKDIPMPRIKEGQVLIKVLYSGICGTDVHIVNGKYSTAKFPLVPGHEFIGELVEINGSSDLQIGDLVAAHPVLTCGNCKPCASGRDNVCENLNILGCQTNGSFAQYVVAPIHKTYSLPKGTDPKIAALLEPLAVAVHDVRSSGLSSSDSALIIGGGPIGLLIALVARQAGATNIAISEISAERCAFAAKMGFSTLSPLDDNFDKNLSTITNNKGFDVVFEVSGNAKAFETAVDHCRITGTIMIIGLGGSNFSFNPTRIVQREITLKGVRVHSQVNFMRAIELLKSGAINDELAMLVSNIFDLSNVKEAFDYAQNDSSSFKVLLKTN